MDYDIAPKIIANRFLVKRQIGQGGMGKVFHVYDYMTSEDAALKQVLLNGLGLMDTRFNADHAKYNFAREFQLLASLRHPHIVEVFTYGFDADRDPYYVMQLLQQPEDFLRATQMLPLHEKIALTVQMLRALLYLHHRGIIHRDIKPGNVLLSEGRLRVLDFGLASKQKPAADGTTSHSVIEGTLAYMAPELLKGESFSVASDLYAVGIMLYEAIAGQHPFPTDNINNLVTAILTQQPNFEAIRNRTRSGDAASENFSDTKIIMVPDVAEDIPTLLLKADDAPTAHETLTQAIAAQPSESVQQEPPRPVTTEADFEAEEVYFNIIGIIAKLLEKDPSERYQHAADVIRDLSDAIGEEFPIETSATRESFLQAAEFIGRERELEILRQKLTDAQNGAGSILVITGERGIGKTRLIQEIHTQALVSGNIVTVGGATAQKAYAVWNEPLQRLALETRLAPTDVSILRELYADTHQTQTNSTVNPLDPEPQDRQKRLFNTISTLLSRQQQPVVIILEDLHLAGSESLVILRHISQTISSLKLLIIATFSSEETVSLTDQLAGIHYDHLHLSRFSSAEIALLSTSMLGKMGRERQIVEYLTQQTEGNVLFMVEIIRALAEQVGQLEGIGAMETLPSQIITGGIVQLLLRRLDRVPETAQTPLQYAAIIGKQIDAALLGQLFPDLDLEEWLNICASANVLEFSQGSWQFTHHKLRETIELDITPEDIRQLHTRVAEAYAAAYPGNTRYASNIAGHWRSAEQPQQELAYRMTAAEYAYRISAFDEALVQYQRALELLTSEDTLTRCKVQNRIAMIYVMQDQLAQANDVATANAAALETSDHPDLLAAARNILGRIAMIRGEFRDATEHFQTAASIYERQHLDVGTADVLLNEGRLSARMGQFDAAMKNAEQALAIFQQVNRPWDIANTLNLLSSLYGQAGHFSEAASYALQALHMMEALGNREGMAGIQSNLGIINLMQRNNAEAENWLQKAQTIYAEIRQFRGLASCLNNLGMIAMNDNKAEIAKARFTEALSSIAGLEDPHFTSNIRVNLARAEYLLEDYATAMNDFKAVLVIGEQINAMPVVLEALIGIAQILVREGKRPLVMRIRHLARPFEGKSAEIDGLLRDLDEAIHSSPQGSEAAVEAPEEDLHVLIQDITALP